MKSLHQQNIKLVIFDFDGTIADTSEGILDSHKYTLRKMGLIIPSDVELRRYIGGNLLETYINIFGLSIEEARKAVEIYRKRYSLVGIHTANVYSGFLEMLQELKNLEIMVGVATLKADSFARVMLQEMGINEYFTVICGMSAGDNLTKKDLVMKCTQLCGCNNDEVILVGDSENDLIGANGAGVGFIGVTYGFGFSVEKTYNFNTINHPKELSNLIKHYNKSQSDTITNR